MKKPHIQVTDHAVIRYLERVMGYDIERLRREIGRRADPAMKAGAGTVVIDGCRYRIVDGHLVTILGKYRAKSRNRLR